jgi:hypothetical protein
MLKSSNIRECVGIARLAKNDSAQVNRIIDTFSKYGGMTEKCPFTDRKRAGAKCLSTDKWTNT